VYTSLNRDSPASGWLISALLLESGQIAGMSQVRFVPIPEFLRPSDKESGAKIDVQSRSLDDLVGPCRATSAALRPLALLRSRRMWEAKKLFDGKKQKKPPLIVYTSKDYPDWGVPTYAFGITTQVDQVFHLILDALERTITPNE
jgi:hypothetical protein